MPAFLSGAQPPSTPSTLVHHGVSYPPPKALVPSEPRADLLLGCRLVRIQWVDMINNIRYRVVPVEYFEKLLETSRPGVSVVKAVLGLVGVSVADGFSATGEYLYAIDLSSKRLCPYAPGHVSFMGWFQEKVPFVSGPPGPPSISVNICPRTVLQTILESASAVGVEFLVGFETEFILLKSTHPVETVNSHGWSNSQALASGTLEYNVMEEIAEALRVSEIELQMYHSEGAPGQYEVVTGPLPPLQAADALVHTRETIYNIAAKHGLRATLAPRVHMNSCGSGAHAHISVHSVNKPPGSSAHPNLNILESHFLAGVLEHLPEIMILTLPISDSYKRMVDGVWSGGTYVSWGIDNREAPVRLANAFSPSSRNFEVRPLDGTANPYLALAGVLGAGLAGIEGEVALEVQGCDGVTSAAMLGEEGRAALGIKNRLPLTWEEARTRFEQSTFVGDTFGKEFRKKYLSVNKLLQSHMTSGLTEEEALKLLVETY